MCRSRAATGFDPSSSGARRFALSLPVVAIAGRPGITTRSARSRIAAWSNQAAGAALASLARRSRRTGDARRAGRAGETGFARRARYAWIAVRPLRSWRTWGPLWSLRAGHTGRTRKAGRSFGTAVAFVAARAHGAAVRDHEAQRVAAGA